MALEGWEEGKLLEHTAARDFLCDRNRFLLGWQPKGTVAVPLTKTKSERVNVADVVTTLRTVSLHSHGCPQGGDYPTGAGAVC